MALTKSVGEVPLRSPRLGVENEAGPRVPSESEEALHVPGQRITSGLVVQQHVGGELGDLDAVVEDQVGLEARVVEKEAPVQLGKMMSVLRHANLFLRRFRRRKATG